VAYLFTRKSLITIAKTPGLTEDDVLMAVLEAGAEEVNDTDEAFEVVCDVSDARAIRDACAEAGLTVDSAEIAWIPATTIELEDEPARKVLRLVDALEDLDDVQNVYANFDVSDEVLATV
jgi:transcriptional/translational regulatory protein YebC/TACO1